MSLHDAAAMSLEAPAHSTALPLAPQMPNPFLHPQIPAPIASTSTSNSFAFAPPASHHHASSSRLPHPPAAYPRSEAMIQRDARAKEAEKDKRRLSRRKRQGLEGPGRRYKTGEGTVGDEEECSGTGTASGAEKRKRGRPSKSAEGASKKQKGKERAIGAEGDAQGEEDPEAQIMREEAERRDGSADSQSSREEPLGGMNVDAGKDKEDGEEGQDEDDGSQSGRRRGRRRKIINDDIDLESAVAGQSLGPSIDPSSMTMAEIASHPGFGRVSARGMELQARRIELAREKREKLLRRKGREGTADGSVRHSSENEDDGGPQTTESAYAQLMKKQAQAEKDARAAAKTKKVNGGAESDPGNNGKDNDPDDDDDDDDNDNDNGDINENDHFRERNAAAQIRIENGNIIIDESSLQIESGQALNDFDLGNMEIIEEHDKDRFINAFSYQRKPRGTRWTREETDLLFEVSLHAGPLNRNSFFPWHFRKRGSSERHSTSLCTFSPARPESISSTNGTGCVRIRILERTGHMITRTRRLLVCLFRHVARALAHLTRNRLHRPREGCKHDILRPVHRSDSQATRRGNAIRSPSAAGSCGTE